MPGRFERSLLNHFYWFVLGPLLLLFIEYLIIDVLLWNAPNQVKPKIINIFAEQSISQENQVGPWAVTLTNLKSWPYLWWVFWIFLNAMLLKFLYQQSTKNFQELFRKGCITSNEGGNVNGEFL